MYYKELIQKQLIEEEELADFYLSQNGSSLYATIFRPPNGFSVIRLSNHPMVKNYQLLPKIDVRLPECEERLSKSVLRAKRKKMHYFLYATLQLLLEAKSHRLTFYVDDSYNTFKEESLPPIFYVERNSRGSRIDWLSIDKKLTTFMETLYRYGFISILKPLKGGCEVYVTTAGRSVIKYLDSRYKVFWEKDRRLIKWHIVHLPSVIFKRSSKLTKIENQERYCIRRRIQERIEYQNRSIVRRVIDKLLGRTFTQEPYSSPIISFEDGRLEKPKRKTNDVVKTITNDKSELKKEDKKAGREKMKVAVDNRNSIDLSSNLNIDTFAKLQHFMEQLDDSQETNE
ncbi:hypothetical protein [Streptococcus respiraculi]|uniref:hypothetical protein n=1 Tax=Streptococcus respiraculi TaxID=2021971 RepID=UPI0013C43E89|nr:hypothetical protein [Streptococcus respiraculi]